ncbi:MAG: hypothetical protein ABI824_17555, partial [Acidobacteriota bacterium]
RIGKLAGVTFIVSLLLLLVRFAVVRGIGGYPDHPGVGSPHLSFTMTTLQSLVTKLFPVTLMASNQMFPMPGSVRVVLGCFAVLLVASVFAGASVSARGRWFAVFAILSTAPVATLVSWLDPAAQHTRYVYMPAFFVMVMVAVALSNARRSGWLLAAFVGLSMAVGVYNANVYRATYQRAAFLASAIRADSRDVFSYDIAPIPQPGTREIRILNMPSEFNGVLFSQFELGYLLGLPKDPFLTLEGRSAEEACGYNLCYLWDPASRGLIPVLTPGPSRFYPIEQHTLLSVP